MDSLRFLLLFSVLVFGAYSEYAAGSTVKKIRFAEARHNQYKKEIRNEDIGFVKRAIALGDHGDRSTFGSLVVRNGEIIGAGRDKTNVTKDPSAHAVVEAIRDASTNLSSKALEGCHIYTSAQPCPMCLSLIYLTGIERIYYSIHSAEFVSHEMNLSVGSVFLQLIKQPKQREIPEIPVVLNDMPNVNDNWKVR